MRALATSPRPAFDVPEQVQVTDDRVIAVSSSRVVHAIFDGQIIRGRLRGLPGAL